MTTVVVDRKERVMVADRMGVAAGNHKFRVTKLFNLEEYGVVIGGAGTLEALSAFVTWYLEEVEKMTKDPKNYKGSPENLNYPRTNEFNGLVLHRNGQLSSYGQYGYPVRIESRYYGVGSGSDYALGAIYAGADLEEAVRIASKLDPSTGLGVQVEYV